MSTFLSNDSASTSIASSESVWVSVAISPSSISFLITSGAPSCSDSATSLTVEPERTCTAGSSGVLGLQLRQRLRLEIRLDPLGPTPPAASATRRLRLLRRRGAVAPGCLGVDHHAPAPASAATVSARTGLATTATRRARAAAAAATLTAA